MRTAGPEINDSTSGRIEGNMLANAKELLRQSLERHAPDAFLTHAWEDFFRVHTAFLRQVALHFRLDAQETEDLVQEVWLAVYKRLPELGSPNHLSGLRAWLFVLVRNKAFKFLHRKARRPLQLVDNERLQEAVDPRRSVAETWEEASDRDMLQVLLAEMKAEISAENHRLLQLRLVEGRTLAEAAQELGTPVRRLRDRQKRLFRKLRGKVAVYHGRALERLGDASSEDEHLKKP